MPVQKRLAPRDSLLLLFSIGSRGGQKMTPVVPLRVDHENCPPLDSLFAGLVYMLRDLSCRKPAFPYQQRLSSSK